MQSRFVYFSTANVFVMEVISLTVTGDRVWLHSRCLRLFKCQTTVTFYGNQCWSTNVSEMN